MSADSGSGSGRLHPAPRRGGSGVYASPLPPPPTARAPAAVTSTTELHTAPLGPYVAPRQEGNRRGPLRAPPKYRVRPYDVLQVLADSPQGMVHFPVLVVAVLRRLGYPAYAKDRVRIITKRVVLGLQARGQVRVTERGWVRKLKGRRGDGSRR